MVEVAQLTEGWSSTKPEKGETKTVDVDADRFSGKIVGLPGEISVNTGVLTEKSAEVIVPMETSWSC